MSQRGSRTALPRRVDAVCHSDFGCGKKGDKMKRGARSGLTKKTPRVPRDPATPVRVPVVGVSRVLFLPMSERRDF